MSKYNFSATGVGGTVSMEALLNKLGGIQGARRFLSGELTLVEVATPEPVASPAIWREEDGVITFTVTSDGTTGPEWIERFPNSTKWAKDILRSPDFVPTNKVTTKIRVLKGILYADADRVTENICADAKRRGFTTPHPEVACLIRRQFSNADIAAMGLTWLVVMHEPIEDSGGDPGLLSASRGVGGRSLDASYDGPVDRCSRGFGFAFAAAQV